MIPRDDKRVDLAAGEERRNQIFEYNLATDTIVGADKTERLEPGVRLATNFSRRHHLI